MIEPRVYRAAFVPAVLAAVLAMFSLESRPRPLPQGLAADVLFDGRLAAQSAADLVARHRDRRAGSLGDRATATEVGRAFARFGFRTQRQAFTHAGKDLVNVIGRRAGRSRRELVVIAARDATGVPDAAGSASDTAALLELARVLHGRPSRKTVVLASVDGASLGEVGTERLLDQLGDAELVDAALVISDLGSRDRRGPFIVPWSNDARRGGIGLQRTVAASIRQELDQPVGSTGAFGQLARLALPIGIGAQGALIEQGLDAVRISGSGELPPDAGDGIDQDRLGGLGRATLRTITALDQGPRPAHGPDSYVIAVSQVMPGWVLSLLALTLLLPALVASVDALARARRRRQPVVPWLWRLATWAAPFGAAVAMAELLALVGATPEPPPAAPPPQALPLDGAALAVLGAGVLVGACALWLGRLLALRSEPELAEATAPAAGVALSLVLALTVLVLWVLNPYAALMLVPAAHLWMLAVLVDPPAPPRARVVLVVLGAVPALLVALYYLFALSLDPLSAAWYLTMLVIGGTVGLPTVLVGCALLGVLLGVVSVVRADRGTPEEPREAGPRVYGPGAYAGPGSLGGTESALRR